MNKTKPKAVWEITRIKEFAADGTSCAHLIPAQTICQTDRTASALEIGVSQSQGRNQSTLSEISYQTFYYN